MVKNEEQLFHIGKQWHISRWILKLLWTRGYYVPSCFPLLSRLSIAVSLPCHHCMLVSREENLTFSSQIPRSRRTTFKLALLSPEQVKINRHLRPDAIFGYHQGV